MELKGGHVQETLGPRQDAGGKREAAGLILAEQEGRIVFGGVQGFKGQPFISQASWCTQEPSGFRKSAFQSQPPKALVLLRSVVSLGGRRGVRWRGEETQRFSSR